MEGVRVVEVGFWVAGPACSAILADWGADVIKVEPLAGDPFRSLGWLYGGEMNPPFELDNRGKRSISLDFGSEAGLEVVLDLVDRADVFVSNLRPGALERAGLDPASLCARNPRLVYAAITGYGLAGDDRDRAAYDVGAFWSRAGIVQALTPEGRPFPYQRGGMGDHMTGMSAAGAVSAALFARERTGKGQLIAASLLRLGMYMVGWDTNVALRAGGEIAATSRDAPPNPLINAYTCGDGRSFWMLGLESDRHWPDVLAALDRADWATDPRFESIETRLAHADQLVAELDAIFAGAGRDRWTELFDRHNVWWAPIQAIHEAIKDPQARAAGAMVDVPMNDGTTAEMVATPVDFYGTPWSVQAQVPELGQDTELVLMELGREWEEIDALKAAGIIN